MRLTVRTGEMAGTVHELSRGIVIGRGEGCDLALLDEQVSRRHAALEPRADGTLVLTDLGSANGTFVNGHLIAGPVRLAGGEELRVGDTVCTVDASAVAASTPGAVAGRRDAVALAVAAAVLAGVGTAIGLALGGR